MKVSDYELDWNSGSVIFNCCDHHITSSNEECKIGEVIECDECGISFILEERNGKVMWRAVK